MDGKLDFEAAEACEVDTTAAQVVDIAWAWKRGPGSDIFEALSEEDAKILHTNKNGQCARFRVRTANVSDGELVHLQLVRLAFPDSDLLESLRAPFPECRSVAVQAGCAKAEFDLGFVTGDKYYVIASLDSGCNTPCPRTRQSGTIELRKKLTYVAAYMKRRDSGDHYGKVLDMENVRRFFAEHHGIDLEMVSDTTMDFVPVVGPMTHSQHRWGTYGNVDEADFYLTFLSRLLDKPENEEPEESVGKYEIVAKEFQFVITNDQDRAQVDLLDPEQPCAEVSWRAQKQLKVKEGQEEEEEDADNTGEDDEDNIEEEDDEDNGEEEEDGWETLCVEDEEVKVEVSPDVHRTYKLRAIHVARPSSIKGAIRVKVRIGSEDLEKVFDVWGDDSMQSLCGRDLERAQADPRADVTVSACSWGESKEWLGPEDAKQAGICIQVALCPIDQPVLRGAILRNGPKDDPVFLKFHFLTQLLVKGLTLRDKPCVLIGVGTIEDGNAHRRSDDEEVVVEVEQTTRHEIGHLCGLVPKTLPGDSEHTEWDSGAHCKNECLMKEKAPRPAMFCSTCATLLRSRHLREIPILVFSSFE